MKVNYWVNHFKSPVISALIVGNHNARPRVGVNACISRDPGAEHCYD
jgi:hypothetical protein